MMMRLMPLMKTYRSSSSSISSSGNIGRSILIPTIATSLPLNRDGTTTASSLANRDMASAVAPGATVVAYSTTVTGPPLTATSTTRFRSIIGTGYSTTTNNKSFTTGSGSGSGSGDFGGVISGISNADDSGSHSDFAPQPRAPPPTLNEPQQDEQERMMKETLSQIDGHVRENPVMLYMKGNPEQPQCGFSARVVKVLQSTGVAFASVNVLNYPRLREGIKRYSQWPTIPQLYVHGEFVGGCDIIESMHASGELQQLLKQPKQDPPQTTTSTN